MKQLLPCLPIVPLHMQSIHMMKNIHNMRSKGVNKKIISCALHFMKPYLHAKFEVYRYYGYWVLLLQADSEEDEEDYSKNLFSFTKLIMHTQFITLHPVFDKG